MNDLSHSAAPDDLSLGAALDRLSRDGDALTVPLPENWMQGRTTYGGFSAALLLGAVLKNHSDLPPLRSALINFVAPLSASPRLFTQPLRAGRNVTSVAAQAMVDGQIAAQGSFAFGVAQNSEIRFDVTGPDAPAPEECEPMIPPQAEAFAPRFHRNFEMRLIEGDRPFSGSDRPYMRAWIRHRDPASWAGTAALLCLADALPPAVFPMFRRLGPNSSVTWMCNFPEAAPRTRDGWWQMDTRATAARDGYSSQVMRVWNSDGALVVDGMQSVLVFV